MNTKIITGREVLRPSTTPIPSSILDHATVGPDNAQFGWVNNDGMWVSYNCVDTWSAATPCDDDPAMKDFTFGAWQPSFEFAGYAGVQCSNVGLDREDMVSEAKRVFLINEGKVIESALLATRFVVKAAGGANDPVSGQEWAAPTDLTTAPSLLSAIGMLEGYGATQYAGVVTLHLPRAVISMAFAAGALVERGGKFFTKAGSKVAAGGGYDDSTAPISGTMNLYATGEVYVEKAPLDDLAAYVTPGDGLVTESVSGNDFTDNTSIVLVERMYRAAVDCFVAKVAATVWS